jgi:ferredoxin
VRVEEDACIRCGKCSRACPMNIDVMNAKKGRVTSAECINCNECVTACPVQGAIHTGYSKKLRIHPIVATILALFLFFAPMGIAAATGDMQLLPNKYVGLPWGAPTTGAESGGGEGGHEEETVTEAALPAADTSETVEEDFVPINGYEPSDLSGSFTLDQTATLLDLPLNEIYALLGLPADYPSSATLRDAAADMGMGLSDFKHQLFE